MPSTAVSSFARFAFAAGYTWNRVVLWILEKHMLIPLIETVDKAVEYILAQPDGMPFPFDPNLTWRGHLLTEC